MKILVITSCTSTKKHKPDNQLQIEDFCSPNRLAERTADLKPYEVPAAKMYTGQQHKLVLEGLEQVRGDCAESDIDLSIISAGYGLLRADEPIVPYDVTFTGLRVKALLARRDALELHRKVGNLIKDYELVFFLLGREYVRALQIIFENPSEATQIILAPPSWNQPIRRLASSHRHIHVVCTGEDLANQLSGASKYNLKGFLFKKVCEAACRDGLQLFEEIRQHPQMIRDIALEGK